MCCQSAAQIDSRFTICTTTTLRYTIREDHVGLFTVFGSAHCLPSMQFAPLAERFENLTSALMHHMVCSLQHNTACTRKERIQVARPG